MCVRFSKWSWLRMWLRVWGTRQRYPQAWFTPLCVSPPSCAPTHGNYDPLDYAFALYGDPRLPPPWAWSVDGHHLSLHFTLVGETEITMTPLFMGVAPSRRI